MKVISVAKALIVDDASNILILYRSKTHPTMAFMPDLPGGIVEPGEDFGHGLIREIHEEIGLTINLADLTPAYAGAETHTNQNRVRVLYIVRLSEIQPELNVSWEHDRAEWIPAHQIDKIAKIEAEFIPFYRHALEYIQDNKLL